MWSRGKFSLVVLTIQVIYIIIFAVFVRYDKLADAKIPVDPKGKPNAKNLEYYYAMFQDVNVMIFFGFGLLMTFLKKYGFGAVGFNFLLACLAVQWAIIMQNFWDTAEDGKIHLNITSLISAEFASATVLISYGALLGKVSHLQLVVMGLIEITIFACNEHLGIHVFQAVDIGGSIFLHTFGAYFGLAVAFVLYRKEYQGHEKTGSTYQSDIFSMIGTLFLWMFWPSFNSVMADDHFRHRAVINTYLSITACCVFSFVASSFVNPKSKLNMVHIQNATLAGGVAIGATANMMTSPFGALIIGGIAGVLSVVGYQYLSPILVSRCRLHDSCGVNNLHGMPGVLAGLIGAIMAFSATESQYAQSNLYLLFPARAPEPNSPYWTNFTTELSELVPGEGRSASSQAVYQLIALAVTLVIAIGGGLATGLLLRLPFFNPPTFEQLYDDTDYWELPSEDEGHVKPYFRKEDDTKV